MITRFAAISSAVVVLSVCGVTFLSYANNAANNITPSITTSRYIMFGGAFKVSSEIKSASAHTEENGVFKIDTYTGKAWILKASVSSDGQRTEKWSPVTDDN